MLRLTRRWPAREADRSAARRATLAAVTVLALGGCGSRASLPAGLIAGARPIGHAPRFHPPATGPVPGRCRAALGPRFGVHVEVFAANRVLLIPSGIGSRPPRRLVAGRIAAARCFGELVTLEPTGVVLVRPGRRHRLADLFRAWGQPLSRRRLAGFRTPDGSVVEVFVGGRRWRGAPADVPLTHHAEIVLEVGPHVPPHASYTFPPGT